MWVEHLQGRVHTKELSLMRLSVKNLMPFEIIGVVEYSGKREEVYKGASLHEAKGACEDRAIVLLRDAMSKLTSVS